MTAIIANPTESTTCARRRSSAPASSLPEPTTTEIGRGRPPAICTTTSVTLPRFNLRKRSVVAAEKAAGSNAAAGVGSGGSLPLTGVNSAFLDSLFADVAQVQTNPSEGLAATGGPENSDDAIAASLICPETIRPPKKSRVSLSKSISRCGRSFANLGAAACLDDEQDSPTGVIEAVSDKIKTAPRLPTLLSKKKRGAGHGDSLHFQLSCVSGDYDGACPPRSNDSSPGPSTFRACELVFPCLPPAVSNTSCATGTTSLTRSVSDLQSSVAESDGGEGEDREQAYGWFVAVDGDDGSPVPPAMTTVGATATTTCAAGAATSDPRHFVAPIAPNAVNQDAEVEWAKAADTVDDVLGDFF